MSDADLLAQLAREFDAEPDLDRLLQRVVDATHAQVPGADHVGIMLFERGVLTTPATTSPKVSEVDQIQCETQQGPCWQAAIDETSVVMVDDLSTEQRWPRFTPRALETGIRGILSFQLWARSDTIGAVNIYADTAHAFGEDSVHLGGLLAAHAAVGIATTRKELNLHVALASRDVIGQAKGILMERFKIDSERAFGVLIEMSQRTHRKLHAVAEDLARTGELTRPVHAAEAIAGHEEFAPPLQDEAADRMGLVAVSDELEAVGRRAPEVAGVTRQGNGGAAERAGAAGERLTVEGVET